jgi:hypothetical protein
MQKRKKLMTNTPYHVLNLVQLEGVAEWYVAIPQPPAEKNEATGQDVPRLLIDVNKDLTFAVDDSTVKVAALKPVSLLNRYIPITLEFIPGMFAVSPFDVLVLVLGQTMANGKNKELTEQQKLVMLTLHSLFQTLGEGLQQALTAELEPTESLYVQHDFLVHRARARLRQAGVKVDDPNL